VKISSRKLWLNVILFLQLIGEERDMEWKVTHFGSTVKPDAQILEKSKHVVDECFGTFLCPMIRHTLHIWKRLIEWPGQNGSCPPIPRLQSAHGWSNCEDLKVPGGFQRLQSSWECRLQHYV
jgi:hypothetical protein